MRVLAQTTIFLDVVSLQFCKYCNYGISRLSLMYTIYCERRQMRNLSDETLSDIGINRAQLRREYSRKISDIPENRISASRKLN